MNRTFKYGLIIILILTIGIFVAYGIFINNFALFGEPKKEILKVTCDNLGLRQATIFKYGGNAVTNPSILVSTDLGCADKPDDAQKKIIFSVEQKKGTTVETKWKSFDTLKILYSKELEPIIKLDKITFADSTLNVTIEYNKK